MVGLDWRTQEYKEARGWERKPLGLAGWFTLMPFESQTHSLSSISTVDLWGVQITSDTYKKLFCLEEEPCTPILWQLNFVTIHIISNTLMSTASGFSITWVLPLQKEPEIYTHGSSPVAEGHLLDKWEGRCLQDHSKQIGHALGRLAQHSRKYHHLKDKCARLQISERLLWSLWFLHISHFWVIFFLDSDGFYTHLLKLPRQFGSTNHTSQE